MVRANAPVRIDIRPTRWRVANAYSAPQPGPWRARLRSSMKIRASTAHRQRDLAIPIRRMYQSIEQFRKRPALARVALSRFNRRSPSTQGLFEQRVRNEPARSANRSRTRGADFEPYL